MKDYEIIKKVFGDDLLNQLQIKNIEVCMILARLDQLDRFKSDESITNNKQ